MVKNNFLNSVDEQVILLLFSVEDQEWVKNGDDPDPEFAEKISDLQSSISLKSLVPHLELFYGGPGLTDVWLSRNELKSDILEEDPDLEDEIEEDNRMWFRDQRNLAYEYLNSLELIDGITMSKLIQCMKKRGVI